jgi:hypothetical protein
VHWCIVITGADPMVDHLYYTFYPGEFVRYIPPNGNARIGRIISVAHNTVSVQWWLLDEESFDPVFLPPSFMESEEHDIIPTPLLSSLVFMFRTSDITSFKVRYVYGMKNIISIKRDVFFHYTQQSLTSIICEGLSHISFELQRIMCNTRERQQCYSSVRLQISALTWRYLLEMFEVQEHDLVKVNTFSCLSGRDLSTTSVKTKSPCKILRVEDEPSLLRVISVFGLSAVVGVRKKPPKASKLLGNDTCTSRREGALTNDVVNVVDVESNANRPPAPKRFTFDARGRKGIDFLFFPEQSSLKMTVRYSSFVLGDIMEELYRLGLPRRLGIAALTDDEIEELLHR